MAGPGPVPVKRTRLGSLHPAVVLGGFIAAVAADLVGGWPVALVLALLAVWGLVSAGWDAGHLAALLRPWLPVAVLVLGVHTLTTVSAAPLGHPSGQGLLRGVVALVRLAGVLMGLALIQGTLDIEGMVAGVTWWLRPLGGRLPAVRDLGLVVAVAVGAAPRVLAEGRRLQAVLRLRRAAGTNPAHRWSPRGITERVMVVVPLLEGLTRRAETMSLSLRPRRPGADARTGAPGSGQVAWLLAWTVLLAAMVVGAGRLP